MKRILIYCACLMASGMSCTSPFEPDTREEGGLLVVEGSIIKGRDVQLIRISRSTSVSSPEQVPVENCLVEVVDDAGNTFTFEEGLAGEYSAVIDQSMLQFGRSYRLNLIAQGGVYASSWQELPETAPVDSFYCRLYYEYSPFTQAETRLGIKFYVDLQAPEEASRYYRWQVEETWEQHASYPYLGVYDGESITLSKFPVEDLFSCYPSAIINGFFSETTINLTKNSIMEVPLNFVSSVSKKLIIRYGATLRQYALTEEAYYYWRQKQEELSEAGEIYTRQPRLPVTNIYHVNDPDEQVLGFFWASSLSESHLMLKNPFYRKEPGPDSCELAAFYVELEHGEELLEYMYYMLEYFSFMLPDPPIYIIEQPRYSFFFVINPECVDCRLSGGDVVQPDFWDMEIVKPEL